MYSGPHTHFANCAVTTIKTPSEPGLCFPSLALHMVKLPQLECVGLVYTEYVHPIRSSELHILSLHLDSVVVTSNFPLRSENFEALDLITYHCIHPFRLDAPLLFIWVAETTAKILGTLCSTALFGLVLTCKHFDLGASGWTGNQIFWGSWFSVDLGMGWFSVDSWVWVFLLCLLHNHVINQCSGIDIVHIKVGIALHFLIHQSQLASAVA